MTRFNAPRVGNLHQNLEVIDRATTAHDPSPTPATRPVSIVCRSSACISVIGVFTHQRRKLRVSDSVATVVSFHTQFTWRKHALAS